MHIVNKDRQRSASREHNTFIYSVNKILMVNANKAQNEITDTIRHLVHKEQTSGFEGDACAASPNLPFFWNHFGNNFFSLQIVDNVT